MTETLEYIEAYFQQSLDEAEKRNFEMRCEKDEAFAKKVAFYVTSRQLLREKLLQQKQAQWMEENMAEERLPAIIPVKKMFQRKWLMYAAACLILAVSVYLFEKPATPQQLAKNYITANCSQLSQTMDGNPKDSLQLGIAFYNNKEYEKALQLFNAVAEKYPTNGDAKKYAGFVYLVTANYDKALEEFQKLVAIKSLYNPGDFYSAVALLERDQPGDKEAAEKLLQKVVNEKEEGSTEAEKWLRSFNN